MPAVRWWSGISIGDGGWIRLRWDEPERAPFVLVRLALNADNYLEVRSVHFDNDQRLTEHRLRDLGLQEVEDFVNDDEVARLIRLKLRAGDPRCHPLDVLSRTAWPEGLSDAVDCRLDVPTRRPYPVDFLKQVAELVEELVELRVAPAPAIARANDVSVRVVQSWTARCRALGLLAPARGAGTW